MFADTDPFWKPPTVYDVLSVVGLALGIASIWYAWHLARKQLRADFRKAADEAVDRVAQLVLGGDLADAVRFLREADAALGDKDWLRGILRIDDARSHLARISANPRLTADERKAITGRLADLNELLVQTREHSRSTRNRGHMPQDQVVKLSHLITELEQLRGRLTVGLNNPTTPEGGHG